MVEQGNTLSWGMTSSLMTIKADAAFGYHIVCVHDLTAWRGQPCAGAQDTRDFSCSSTLSKTLYSHQRLPLPLSSPGKSFRRWGEDWRAETLPSGRRRRVLFPSVTEITELCRWTSLADGPGALLAAASSVLESQGILPHLPF